MGLKDIPDERALVIGACDNGLLYNPDRLEALLADPAVDVIAFGVRGHARAQQKPDQFGWINADAAGHVANVSVKAPLSDAKRDPIVTGAFVFKQAGLFRACVKRMVERDSRISGEFYVDECLNQALALGLSVRLFEVDHYVGWGTPDELHTFEYWQSCFHKLDRHPYRLERDFHVPADAVGSLEARYAARVPPRPSRDAALA
jgi:hypothetical protein